MEELSIGTEHYAKAALGATEAEALLKRAQGYMNDHEYALADVYRQEATIQSNIALAHAMISATANRGYDATRMSGDLNQLTAAIRVHGS
jgi:hypothetical protein